MQVFPKLTIDNQLYLDVYSNKVSDINSVDVALSNQLNDQYDRQDVPLLEREEVDTQHASRFRFVSSVVNSLQDRWGIQFFRVGEQTLMKISASGTGFRCREITRSGSRGGCLNLAASDEAEAKLLCALRARQIGWFSGESERGACGL